MSRRSGKSSETKRSGLTELTTLKLKNDDRTETLPKKDEEKTTLLQEEGTMLLQPDEEGTTVLEEATTVLQEEQTTVLTENTRSIAQKYELTLNEMIIHTQERI